jgi:hypothetical protein
MVAQPKPKSKLAKYFASATATDDSPKAASTYPGFGHCACLASQGSSRQRQDHIEPNIDTGSASAPQNKRPALQPQAKMAYPDSSRLGNISLLG